MKRLCPACNRRVPVVFETDGEATRPGIDITTIYEGHDCAMDWQPVDAPKELPEPPPEPPKLTPGPVIRAHILGMLHRKPCTRRELINTCTASYNGVGRHLDKLMSEGLISRTGSGGGNSPYLWRLA